MGDETSQERLDENRVASTRVKDDTATGVSNGVEPESSYDAGLASVRRHVGNIRAFLEKDYEPVTEDDMDDDRATAEVHEKNEDANDETDEAHLNTETIPEETANHSSEKEDPTPDPEINNQQLNDAYNASIAIVNGIINDAQRKVELISARAPENMGSSKTEPNPVKAHVEDLDPDTVCGIGNFKPPWLQRFATSQSYLVLYAIIGIVQGSYYSYLIGTLSTLEKRFAFKSKISGGIMMIDEITPLLMGVFVGYFGGKAHRPRMLAVGMFMAAMCSFVSMLPYFIYGPAQHLVSISTKNESAVELCSEARNEENCDADDRPPTLAAVLFLMLGSFLKGFGNLAYYAVGLSYMDDNAKKKDTPLYYGVVFAFRLLGPTLGFLMSSAFLKIYENPFVDPGFGPEDPRWIGAWWIGFLLQGILIIIFTLPILLFPRRLPQHKMPFVPGDGKRTLANEFKEMYKALKRLVKNPVYMFLVANTICAIYGSFGHYIMLPKYMEHQFRLSASDASLYSGPPGLVAIMAASIIGGVIIWKTKPNAKILTASLVVTEIIAVVGYFLLMIPQCDNVEIFHSGVNVDGLDLSNECNAKCMCTNGAFTPLCGPDGKTAYFSPCYAGCDGYHDILPANGSKKATQQIFENCSCVINSTGHFVSAEQLERGFCANDACWNQALGYITLLPIIYFFCSLTRVVHTMILFRAVDPPDKSVALGLFEAFICLLGFVPYPPMFGAIADSTCLIWEKSCGQQGNCWFYDMDRFNYTLHGLSSLFCTFSTLFLLGAFMFSSRVRDLYKDDPDPAAEAHEDAHKSKSSNDTKF